MENRHIFMAGLSGGFITALFGSIPYLNLINCFCCIGIMLGGAVALIHYEHLAATTKQYISSAQAVTLGITAGLIGSFLSLLFSWLIYLQFGHWDIRLLQTMAEHMEEVPAYFENALQELEDQASAGFQWVPVLFSNLIMYPLFCLAGALLTRLLLNKSPHRPRD
jgi:hypothetical protein